MGLHALWGPSKPRVRPGPGWLTQKCAVLLGNHQSALQAGICRMEDLERNSHSHLGLGTRNYQAEWGSAPKCLLRESVQIFWKLLFRRQGREKDPVASQEDPHGCRSQLNNEASWFLAQAVWQVAEASSLLQCGTLASFSSVLVLGSSHG